MTRKGKSLPTPAPSLTDAALDAIGADELRRLVREIIPWLDAPTHARLVNMLVDQAARSPSGWAPVGPNDKAVANIVAFAEAAERVGYAEPADVDEYLRQGSNAFLGKDYRAAGQIFRALLLPIGEGDIDLGQDEMVDEVLGVDLADCAAQYVVSAYMTATPATRGAAVLTAIDEMDAFGHFWEPLGEIERVAVEPLPEIEAFLLQWRALVEERVAKESKHDRDTNEDRWLREVIGRMEGVEGLAKVARATRRGDDLRAWCDAIVDAKDWTAALPAFEEAAELVTDHHQWRGEFLDGAARAAQELGRKDLPARLEQAWREAPNMLRLGRWIGSAKTTKALRDTATAALAACPKKSYRQRALLNGVLGDLVGAADLLANAPGLGWSDGEHPGHLIFPLFSRLLGGTELSPKLAHDYAGISLLSETDEPRLAAPEIDEILDLAGLIKATPDGQTRSAMLKAMQRAAEKRLAGVVENKRRRHYGHAAQLVAVCATADSTKETATWVAGIRTQYRRFPALQGEFDRHCGRR